MHSRSLRYILHKFRTGFALRCPNCEQGRLFAGGRFGYALQPTCDYCAVRFARGSGDAIGGVYINIAIAEFTALTGFFAVDSLLGPPVMLQIFIWIPYVILFSLLFFRHARGLWIALMYLSGGVYADPDYTREYLRPIDRRTHDEQPHHR